MKLAVIGAGISGMGAAWLAAKAGHDVTLFEREARLGGHARTLTVTHGDRDIAVDTGFIVFNNRNYPNLLGLFAALDVPYHNSDMSFAASIGQNKSLFEYSSRSLGGMFPKFSTMLQPKRYRMLSDYFTFSKAAKKFLKNPDHRSLAALIQQSGVSDYFTRYFIIPMGAAIWSCPVSAMMDYPAKTFVQFFENHGLLDYNGQPQWYTVTGGSRSYVEKLIADFSGQVRLRSANVHVARHATGVTVTIENQAPEHFDHAILAAHADESLAMLENPSAAERDILSAFCFQKNIAYLHADPNFMPQENKCWASWVYLSRSTQDKAPALAVTYWMNLLQGIDANYPLFVTLNPPEAPRAPLVFNQHEFTHPIFDAKAIAAQTRIPDINGVDKISYAGAWQRYGFHEDGLWSAVRAVKNLGISVPWENA